MIIFSFYFKYKLSKGSQILRICIRLHLLHNKSFVSFILLLIRIVFYVQYFLAYNISNMYIELLALPCYNSMKRGDD